MINILPNIKTKHKELLKFWAKEGFYMVVKETYPPIVHALLESQWHAKEAGVCIRSGDKQGAFVFYKSAMLMMSLAIDHALVKP